MWRKYERASSSKEQQTQANRNIKYLLFTRAIPYTDRLLAEGDCCNMSDIVAFAPSLLEECELLSSTF